MTNRAVSGEWIIENLYEIITSDIWKEFLLTLNILNAQQHFILLVQSQQ